jgi:alkylhydroperoxidase/carboxymuconolactone decarboxylase family protein YurZ
MGAMHDHVDKLRDLARGVHATSLGTSLDRKTDALVRVSALIATGAEPAAYFDTVESALSDGVSAEEVVDTLVAVSQTVGAARVVSASRGLALALGYDIDAALEGYTRS